MSMSITSFTIFASFIPLLALILLVLNFVFAPHVPYKEKGSTFECGCHSFLGQNRTQFSISFFIFALLFLLFDLEILLVYPFVVSAYTISIYGLIIIVTFLSVLTLGFVFEFGKGALKMDNKQMFNKNNLVSSILDPNTAQLVIEVIEIIMKELKEDLPNIELEDNWLESPESGSDYYELDPRYNPENLVSDLIQPDNKFNKIEDYSPSKELKSILDFNKEAIDKSSDCFFKGSRSLAIDLFASGWNHLYEVQVNASLFGDNGDAGGNGNPNDDRKNNYNILKSELNQAEQDAITVLENDYIANLQGFIDMYDRLRTIFDRYTVRLNERFALLESNINRSITQQFIDIIAVTTEDNNIIIDLVNRITDLRLLLDSQMRELIMSIASYHPDITVLGYRGWNWPGPSHYEIDFINIPANHLDFWAISEDILRGITLNIDVLFRVIGEHGHTGIDFRSFLDKSTNPGGGNASGDGSGNPNASGSDNGRGRGSGNGSGNGNTRGSGDGDGDVF